MAHHDRGMDFGDHYKTEVLFEIKTIRQSGKGAKNQLMNNREWGVLHAFAQLWADPSD